MSGWLRDGDGGQWTVDSGWQRSEQPLTSHALYDCKLVGPVF